MKILLTHPLWPHSDQMGKFRDINVSKFCHGMASILGYFRDHAHESLHASYVNSENMSVQEFEKYLLETRPDVVGLNSFIFSVTRLYETVDLIKTILPTCRIIVGGNHVTQFPERTLQECNNIDFVIVSEGEVPFTLLCNELAGCGRGGMAAIPNLFYREGGRIVSTEKANLLKDDQIPRSDYSKFPMDTYGCATPLFKRLPTPNIVVSRGCPFNCAFCAQNSLLGRSIRYKNVDTTIEEILELRDVYGAKGLWFQDSIFTADKRWVHDFCKKLSANKIDLPWGCLTRVDCVDEKLLVAMRDAGCWQIGYGIESGNQKTLDSMKKRVTVSQNADVVSMTRRLGIKIYASFIIGWPGENLDDVDNTIKFAKKIRPHTALFHTPVPYPRTDLFDMCVEEGSISPDISFDLFQDGMSSVQNKCIYVNPRIGKSMMERIASLAYKRFYMSYNGIEHVLSYHSTDQLLSFIPKIKSFARIILKR